MKKIKELVADFLYGNYATAAVRIFCGALMLFAGVFKAVDPQGFAQVVARYNVLPAALVPLAALVIPWVEVFAGLSLIAGFRVRGAALVSLSLMAVFAAGISVNLARGEIFDCGCFELNRLGLAFDETIGPAALARDLALMAVFFVLWRARRHVASLESWIEGMELRDI